MSVWTEQLLAASFRKADFGVLGGQLRFGRRNAVHEYPDRDTIWVEDLGRAQRRISLQGFVVGDDALAKRAALIAACETYGPGTLIHPTLGNLQVSLVEATSDERWDHGRVFEIHFVFIESGAQTFPVVAAATANAVAIKATAAQAAASAAFSSLRVLSALSAGIAAVRQAVATAAFWANLAQGLVNDATNLYNLPGTLQGDFGRYFGGSNFGFSGANPSGTSSIAALKAQAARTRAATATAAAALNDAAANLTATAPAATIYAAAAGTLAEAVAATSANPADGLRLLQQLAGYRPEITPSDAAAGLAANTVTTSSADTMRRSAAIALAVASSAYQPASYDDAVKVRTQVCAVLDAESATAGDQGEDSVFLALRSLRAAVVQDLTARGANLAVMQTVTAHRPLPSLVWAQRLYRDPTRAPELVTLANPVHPAFMPVQFMALSNV